MVFVLLLLGSLFLIAGIRGTETELVDLIKGDFTGQGNFLYFIAAILILGSLGYIRKIKPASDAMIFLIILVLFISNRGFFTKLPQQLGLK